MMGHAVCRINTNGIEYTHIECTCGWEYEANMMFELFDAWHNHMLEVEVYGNVLHEGNDRPPESDGELPEGTDG